MAMLPIDSIQFGCFLGAAIILAVTPGPGILYVSTRTISGGKADGLASALGTTVGGLAHVLFAAAGLTALLAASAEAFLTVKYIGAAYLVYIGVRRIVSARVQSGPPTVQATGVKRVFLEGVLTEALNVKTALFFLAFIPQFVNFSAHVTAQFVVFGLICVLLNATVDLSVVLLASRMVPRFQTSPKSVQITSYSSGTVLIGLGVYVALAHGQR